MTDLRQRMAQDLRIRNYAPSTIKNYIDAVKGIVKHFRIAPDRLTAEHIRTYQVPRREQEDFAVVPEHHRLWPPHTWGQNLMHHPHVHHVVPGGGVSPDGSRWIASRSKFFLPVRFLSRLFRGKFLDGLRRAFDQKKLSFHGQLIGPVRKATCLFRIENGGCDRDPGHSDSATRRRSPDLSARRFLRLPSGGLGWLFGVHIDLPEVYGPPRVVAHPSE